MTLTHIKYNSKTNGLALKMIEGNRGREAKTGEKKTLVGAHQHTEITLLIDLRA